MSETRSIPYPLDEKCRVPQVLKQTPTREPCLISNASGTARGRASVLGRYPLLPCLSTALDESAFGLPSPAMRVSASFLPLRPRTAATRPLEKAPARVRAPNVPSPCPTARWRAGLDEQARIAHRGSTSTKSNAACERPRLNCSDTRGISSAIQARQRDDARRGQLRERRRRVLPRLLECVADHGLGRIADIADDDACQIDRCHAFARACACAGNDGAPDACLPRAMLRRDPLPPVASVPPRPPCRYPGTGAVSGREPEAWRRTLPL